VGLASIITRSPQEATAVESAFEQLMRAEVSNPPAFGARVAAAVMEDGELRAEWARNLSTMSSRIEEMRWALFDGLKKLGPLFPFVIQKGSWQQLLTKCAFLETPGSWDRIVKQTGMFCLLGLTREQVVELQGRLRIPNIGLVLVIMMLIHVQ
jgi:aspartate aminotransferase